MFEKEQTVVLLGIPWLKKMAEGLDFEIAVKTRSTEITVNSIHIPEICNLIFFRPLSALLFFNFMH